MKKSVFVSLLMILGVSSLSGFILSRRPDVNLNIHKKDLPENGLAFVLPSDPLFDQKFSQAITRQQEFAADEQKSFSVLLENNTEKTVVAYRIVWAFTTGDGATRYSKRTFSAPRALMEGENLTPDMERQTSKIRPHQGILISAIPISTDGRPTIAFETTAERAQKIREGQKLDTNELREIAAGQLAKYTDTTVSLDGAFFEDGTFVGPNTTGFFEEIGAQIKAKSDLLEEISRRIHSSASKQEILQDLESIANQTIKPLDPKSTPNDHYNYYRMFYAKQVVRSRRRLNDDEAVAQAMHSKDRGWPELRKVNQKH
jgi:hypothetical protein